MGSCWYKYRTMSRPTTGGPASVYEKIDDFRYFSTDVHSTKYWYDSTAVPKKWLTTKRDHA